MSSIVFGPRLWKVDQVTYNLTFDTFRKVRPLRWSLTVIPSTMRPLFAAVLASASLAAAQSTSVEEFWWSYPPMPAENVTDPETKIYIAEFEVCGNGTCESCEPKAKSCLSQQYTNICYEPSSGETCCEDVLGSR